MKLLDQVLDYLLTSAHWTGADGMLTLLWQQLLITATAMVIALVIGLPLALWLGHLGRGGWLAINISGMGRAIPTFALLAVLVATDWPGTAGFGPYGRAGLATLIALVAFALPPIITNAYVGMRQVPRESLEAATGMGMTAWQRFVQAELPHAAALTLDGVRLALVQVWATATIAAMVAGPGLGNVITRGFYRDDVAQGLAGAVVVAAVALVLELVSNTAIRVLDPVPKPASVAA